MLPNDYLKPCVAMMKELISNYRASIVLCTATQPALAGFFGNEIRATELCPRMEEQFRFFERVTYQNIGLVTEEELAERLKQKIRYCVLSIPEKSAGSLSEAAGRRSFSFVNYHVSETSGTNFKTD